MEKAIRNLFTFLFFLVTEVPEEAPEGSDEGRVRRGANGCAAEDPRQVRESGDVHHKRLKKFEKKCIAEIALVFHGQFLE